MEYLQVKPHVIIEGPDGSGKSTLAGEIATTLNRSGFRATTTREPGGWNLSVTSTLREYILYGDGNKDNDITGLAFTLDSWAGYQHTKNVLKTHAVIQDRSVLSRLVYQREKVNDEVTRLFVSKCQYLDSAWTIYLRADRELILSRKPEHLRDVFEQGLDKTIENYEAILPIYRDLCGGRLSVLDVPAGQSVRDTADKAIALLVEEMPEFRKFYEN